MKASSETTYAPNLEYEETVSGLIDKWRHLLGDLPDRTKHDRYVLGCTAMLLENQERHVNGNALLESSRAFAPFLTPLLNLWKAVDEDLRELASRIAVTPLSEEVDE